MPRLKFGTWIPTYVWGDVAWSPAPVREHVAKIRESILKCEEHGIDIWVISHLLSAPGVHNHAWLEPLSVLSYAAALTSRVRLATGILALPLHNPVMLAKEIATLCHLSNDRYLFGVGAGWYAREYEVTGSRIEERGRRTDEMLEAVALLLSRTNVTYEGLHYQFQDVTIDPRPSRLPDVWVGGGSHGSTIPQTVAKRIVRAGHW
jgi:alkanesulfonate monooxygenase SsuD/methylene tetrahydromethanopterin reductase-like flavin-dependent oxidoreductase (luciferase family)